MDSLLTVLRHRVWGFDLDNSLCDCVCGFGDGPGVVGFGG